MRFPLTPHPGGSGVFERLSGAEPRLPGQCAAYAKTGHERLDARLAKEKTAKS